jgi:hypothetical protein
MMALGAALGLGTVLGGYFCVELVLRGPLRFAVSLVVAGFVVRLVLFVLVLALVAAATDLDPRRFLLWMVAFYFVLVTAEAWMLMRESSLPEGTSSR